AVEGLRQEVVGPEAEAFDAGVEVVEAGKDEDRRLDAGGAEGPENLVPVDVRQHEVENDNVVVIELADFEAVLAEVGRVTDEAFRSKHQLDALGRRRIILDE